MIPLLKRFNIHHQLLIQLVKSIVKVSVINIIFIQLL